VSLVILLESSNASEPTSDVHLSRAQQKAVEKILKCKDYYEVLGVSKEADESELKRQYKKVITYSLFELS
jgi:DnaJ family protein B protein 12